MFGAFIGDIVGSKYEFNNIKTKTFPLFSQGCDYTDDSIMTVAVAKAIMLSRTEQFEKNGEGRGFQEFLVEIMQDFGKRYPNQQFCKMAPAAKPEALRKLRKRLCHACLTLRIGGGYYG